MDQRDVGSLLRLNGCDVRQSLLQLQFWTRSGGGRNGKEISRAASVELIGWIRLRCLFA